jgi:hypothetical protein
MPKFPPGVEEEIARYQNGLVLQSSDLSLGAISNMVTKKAIDVSPTFQRRDRWQSVAQSRLIESFLLNIPVPPVYLSEDSGGTYSVIDGKQRITAIHQFMTGGLTLSGLEVLHKLNGLSVTDFPVSIANSLDVRPYVRTVTLLRQSNERVRYEVFLRLNIAGVPLSPMEIRKVAFRGMYCDMVFAEAENEFLKRQLKIKTTESSAYQKMVDAELVLRFLTLRSTWEKFSGDYRDAMDRHMERHHDLRSPEVECAANSFKRAMHFCERLWGSRAFQRPDGDGWRNQALAGVYDSEMVAVDVLSDGVLEVASSRTQAVLKATRDLFECDQEFTAAATLATNTPSRVRYRIEAMKSLLVNVAG